MDQTAPTRPDPGPGRAYARQFTPRQLPRCTPGPTASCSPAVPHPGSQPGRGLETSALLALNPCRAGCSPRRASTLAGCQPRVAAARGKVGGEDALQHVPVPRMGPDSGLEQARGLLRHRRRLLLAVAFGGHRYLLVDMHAPGITLKPQDHGHQRRAGLHGQRGRAAHHAGLLAEELHLDAGAGDIAVTDQGDKLAGPQPLPQDGERTARPAAGSEYLHAEALAERDEPVDILPWAAGKCAWRPAAVLTVQIRDARGPREGRCGEDMEDLLTTAQPAPRRPRISVMRGHGRTDFTRRRRA